MAEQNPDERASFLHSLIKSSFARNQTTIAVGNTKEKVSIVGTNDKSHRKEVKEQLNENEILAKSKSGNHAEENVVAEAEERNLNLTEVGASRPICLDCEELLKSQEITLKTKTSGKKSRKRRKKS